MASTRRFFTDAPNALRCEAGVQLRDKTWAQCGRYGVREYASNPHVNALLCTQHADKKLMGKPAPIFRLMNK